ncbi:MAG: hypothetical protein ABIL68_16725 [bacterium]
MDGRLAYLREHRLFWAVALSLLFHLALLLLSAGRGKIILFPILKTDSNPTDKRIAFEIIETPEDSRSAVPPENATLLSDKNAIARDLAENALKDAGLPYSAGLLDVKSIPQASSEGSDGNRDGGGEESQTESSDTEGDFRPRVVSSDRTSQFSREALLGGKEGDSPSQPRPPYKQEESSAKDAGGIRFNTYAWDFAPYLLDLKRRIEKNIYPPPAFTRLGFGGTNVLRFRVLPDGSLVGPELLGAEGEKALVETSRKAVTLSAPFRPLPGNFPEKFLEVTVTFQYIILKR